jgi:hypothetical protein
MAKENSKSVKIINKGGQTGFVLFITYIGAAVYFVQRSSGFWGFIWALFRAAVWPAYVIHAILALLHIN